MKIFDIVAKTEQEAEILPVAKSDFSIIKRSKRFVFDWSKLKGKGVYKLMQQGNPEILGLMCISEHGEGWDAVEIELIEVCTEHARRKDKKIDGIAGCLIAYACRESIKTGHSGYVFLIPKTDLTEYYQKKYGFMPFGRSLILDDTNALVLIKKYS